MTVPEKARVGVTWSSSDPTIASITANGIVTFHKAGIVEIRASILDSRGTFQVTIEITVYDPEDPNAVGIRLPEGMLEDGVLKVNHADRLSIQFITYPERDDAVFTITGQPDNLVMSPKGELYGTIDPAVSPGVYEATISATFSAINETGVRGAGTITKTLPFTIVVAEDTDPGEPGNSGGSGGGCDGGTGAALAVLLAAGLVAGTQRRGRRDR